MSTHPTYVLDNDAGAAFRADLNNYLDAIRSTNSSATEPSNPIAGMWWVDTSASPVLLKLRDSTNSLWVTIYDITNNEGVIATKANNATTIGGIAVSDIPNTPNTILRTTNTNQDIENNVIGSITGPAQTLGGFTPAQLLDITGRSHKYLDNVTSGLYLVSSARITTQKATVGYEKLLEYKFPISGTVKIAYYGLRAGVPPAATENYYFMHNGTTNITGTLATLDTLPTNLDNFEYVVTKGDTIGIYANLAAKSANDQRVHFAIYIYIYEAGNWSGEGFA